MEPKTLADLDGKYNNVVLGVEDATGSVIAIFRLEQAEVFKHTFLSMAELHELVDILYSDKFKTVSVPETGG